jgi:uncharacterized protein (TIGR02246 family)
MRAWLCCLISLLLLGSWHVAFAESEIPGIPEFLQAWVTAWNAHDVDGILRLHAEDCVTVNRFGTFLVGKEATRRQIEMLHTDPNLFKNTHFPPMHLLHERLLSPEIAVVQVAWQNPSLLAPPAPQINDMIVTFVLKRIAGKWLLEQVDPHNVEHPDFAKP